MFIAYYHTFKGWNTTILQPALKISVHGCVNLNQPNKTDYPSRPICFYAMTRNQLKLLCDTGYWLLCSARSPLVYHLFPVPICATKTEAGGGNLLC